MQVHLDTAETLREGSITREARSSMGVERCRGRATALRVDLWRMLEEADSDGEEKQRRRRKRAARHA